VERVVIAGDGVVVVVVVVALLLLDMTDVSSCKHVITSAGCTRNMYSFNDVMTSSTRCCLAYEFVDVVDDSLAAISTHVPVYECCDSRSNA
jgi:hypothetical protein